MRLAAKKIGTYCSFFAFIVINHFFLHFIHFVKLLNRAPNQVVPHYMDWPTA